MTIFAANVSFHPHKNREPIKLQIKSESNTIKEFFSKILAFVVCEMRIEDYFSQRFWTQGEGAGPDRNTGGGLVETSDGIIDRRT